MDDLVDIDDLRSKLDEKEKAINGIVTASLPQVNVQLPTLSSEAFGTNANACSCPSFKFIGRFTGYEKVADTLTSAEALPMLLKDRAAFAPNAAETTAKQKAAEAQAKAAAAQQRAQEAAREMEDEARRLMEEQQAKASRQFVAPIVAGVSSLLLALCVAYAQLGSFLGPAVVGVGAALANTAGLSRSWGNRAQSIFQVISAQIANAKEKVTTVIDTIDDMIMAPLQRLENTIDDLAEEQKPALNNLQKLESTLDVDIPDPSDLKAPLDGCEDMIDKFIRQAKSQIPEQIDEFVDMTQAGKIATDNGLFTRYVVVLPMATLLVANISLALFQVYIQTNLMSTERGAEQPTKLTQRRLRGAVHGHANAEAELFQLSHIMPCLQPALLQICMTLLQTAAVFALAQGPRLTAAVNRIIKSLQDRVNENLNDSIKDAVDAVFDKAFTQVKEKADGFFPKFQGLLDKLQEVQEGAEKAKQMGDSAQRALGAVKGFW
jgi:hypothetical protein